MVYVGYLCVMILWLGLFLDSPASGRYQFLHRETKLFGIFSVHTYVYASQERQQHLTISTLTRVPVVRGRVTHVTTRPRELILRTTIVYNVVDRFIQLLRPFHTMNGCIRINP